MPQPTSFAATPSPPDATLLSLALLEAAGDMVVVLDAAGRIAVVSERGLALTGLSRQDLIGRDFVDLVSPDIRGQAQEVLSDLLAGNGLSPRRLADCEVMTKGRPRRMAWTLTALAGPDAAATGVLGCCRDVTGVQAAKENLRDTQADYRAIFNAASDAIFIQDSDSGVFLDANDQAAALFGFPQDELRRLTPAVLSQGHPPYTFEESMTKLRLAADGQPQLFEWLSRDKGGRLFWVEVNLRAMVAGRQGRVIAVVRDISERKMAERALRKSEKKFRQLAENIGEVFWLGSTDWKRVHYISPAYETLWGRSVKSLYDAPMSWLDAVHPEDRGRVLDHIAALAGRDIAPGAFPEYRLLRPDGSVRWIHSRIFPVVDDAGKIYRVAGVAEDVTDQVLARKALEGVNERLEDMVRERTVTLLRMNQELIHEVAERREAEAAMAVAKEAAEAASRAKSEFLAAMSHEIRTPMNGILGMAQVLAATALDPDQQAFLGDIEASAASLLRLLGDILDFSMIEADRLELARVPFSLRGVLTLIEEAGPGAQAREKGLGLAIEVEPDVPDALTGDPDRLHQILANLVGNAVKFTSRGGIVIEVRLSPESPPGQEPAPGDLELAFSVSDTGIGIAPADVERIFEAFTQADGSYTRRFGGTGLGLAITRRLVERMSGRIAVSSEPGVGSVFTFTAIFGQDPIPPADAADAPGRIIDGV